MKIKFNVFVLFFALLTGVMYSQVSGEGNSFDIGIHAGMASIQSDYGENGYFSKEVFGNLGVNLGANFYLGFIRRRGGGQMHWFNNHAKLVGGMSYMRTKLDHFGDLVDESSEANLFAAMHTNARLFNLGVALQYHIFDLSEYNPSNTNIFSPFVEVGMAYSYLSPKVYSDLGSIYSNLPHVYQTSNSIYNSACSAFSLTYGVGTRIKVAYNADIELGLKWRMMLSDKLDGLVPQIDANKHNDWMYSINAGYVIYIDE